jgi:hypothetical protein
LTAQSVFVVTADAAHGRRSAPLPLKSGRTVGLLGQELAEGEYLQANSLFEGSRGDLHFCQSLRMHMEAERTSEHYLGKLSHKYFQQCNRLRR